MGFTITMKILKTHITVEVPLMPGMEKVSKEELEKQQESYMRNLLYSKLIDVVDVTSKVVEKE